MSDKILVVDDHDETRRLVASILEENGYKTVTAESGRVGLSLAQTESPDLVLLDVMMPEMDGYEVCRRLRSMSNMVGVPIIMFTAKGQVDEKWAGFSAGADDYLIKPTRPAEMLSRIEMLIDSRRSERRKTTTGKLRAMMGPPDPSQPPEIDDGRSQTEQPKERPRLIAVRGVRGGAGATTVAINLAAALADSGQPTVLVDLDARQGHVAIYLDRLNAPGVGALAGRPTEVWPGVMPQLLLKRGQNLHLLLSQPDLMEQQQSLTADEAERLIDLLLDGGGYVVVDVGGQRTPAALAFINRADDIILCLRPERAAISSARQLLRQMPEQLAAGTRLHALMLDFNESAGLPHGLVAGFLEHPLLATIAIPPQEMAQTSNSGRILVRARPESEAARQFTQLAGQLAPAGGG